ncbi:MAG: glycosyltransferase [Acidobacteriota bacterium]
MRVLHIITGLRRAGAETMLVKLIGAHAGLGIESHVVCLVERGPLADDIERLGAPVTALGMRSKLALGAIPRLIGIVRRLQPDVIQTSLYHADFAGLVAAVATHRLRRLIWNLRNSDLDSLVRTKLSLKVIVRGLARCSALPSGVIVNSHAGRLHHESLGYRPRWWAEIPNGFDLDRWRPDSAAGARLRAQCSVSKDVPIVGMCAHVAPGKDHSNFLKAIAELRAKGTAVHAVLAGRGTEELAPEVAGLRLAGNVSLLGERADLPALVPGLDVFCLSSVSEGFPNVIGEAMASGVPCVATDVGDAATIIANTGGIVPPGQAMTLARALGELLAMSAASRRELGMRARRRIQERYSIAHVARQYLEVYDAVSRGLVPAEPGTPPQSISTAPETLPSSPTPMPGLKHQDVP